LAEVVGGTAPPSLSHTHANTHSHTHTRTHIHTHTNTHTHTLDIQTFGVAEVVGGTALLLAAARTGITNSGVELEVHLCMHIFHMYDNMLVEG